jgi:hypothetical protein
MAHQISWAKNNIYFIKDLKIISRDASPALAQKKALRTARRSALKKILKSLNIDPNFNDIISPEEVDQMTYSEQVKNEKISGNKYSAYFTFRFSQNLIENLLTEKNILRGVKKREKYLILPLAIDNRKRMNFLSKKNNWKKSWEDLLIESQSNIYLFNKNNPDLENIKKFLPHEFISLEQDIINRLINNNGEYIPMVAVYKYDKSQNKIKIKLRIARKYEDKILNFTLINTKFLSKKKFREEAVKKILHYIEKNRFKSKEITQINIDIKLHSKSIEEIKQTQKILENTPEINSVSISSVSKKYSVFKISYNNKYDIFNILHNKNLNLYLSKDNKYIIK